MKPRQVAVIGGGLGGLAAAGHLAARGVAVTVYEGAAVPGGKAGTFHSAGHVLDTGPTLLTLPHVTAETFAAFCATDLLPTIRELEVQAHYRWDGDKSLSTYRDVERTAASAAAFGPGASDSTLRFYQDAAAIYRAAGEPYLEAPFEGTFDFIGRILARGAGAALTGLRLGTLAQLAEKHFRRPELRQFAGRFATYAGLSPFEASAAFAMIPHLEHFYGVHHVEGGIGALAAALAAAVRRLGVTVVTGAKTRYEPWGTGFLATPAEHSEQLVDAVVVNADPLGFERHARVPLTYSGYVLWLEASQRLTLPHHTLLFSSDERAEFAALDAGRLAADLTVYVCHPAATDPNASPAGKSGLFVMVNVPPLPEGEPADWSETAAMLRARCLSLLRRRCPELAGVNLTVLGERTPADLAARGAPRGSIYGFAPRGRLGPFRRPRLRGKERGVFFAGGGTHPGGGVPLVLLSGRFAAQLTLEHLGLGT
jgi:phytoene desaturase